MANRIRTSKSVAKKASNQLRSKKTTKATKSVAGSTLSIEESRGGKNEVKSTKFKGL